MPYITTEYKEATKKAFGHILLSLVIISVYAIFATSVMVIFSTRLQEFLNVDLNKMWIFGFVVGGLLPYVIRTRRHMR